MATGRSFAECVKNKCFDVLYKATEKYVFDKQDTLDLRTYLQDEFDATSLTFYRLHRLGQPEIDVN